MKKDLVIISFAFIFLLSVSIVSAGFFDWLTGDATTKTGSTDIGIRTSSVGADADTKVSSETGTLSTREGGLRSRVFVSSERNSFSRFGAAGDCPRGWNIIKATDGGNCCRKG